MYGTKIIVGAGVTLALILSGTTAMAQVVPSGTPETATAALNSSHPATQSSEVVGQPLDRFVLVRGEPEVISARARPPGGARAFVREDELSFVTETEWRQRGWTMEAFEAVRTDNQHFCSVTANYIVRAASLAQRYAATEPRVADIQQRYVGMAGEIRNAGRTRLGSNVFSSALAWIFGGPLTGGIVTSGAVGNEAQGRAWDRSMMLSRDAGVLNAELTGMHVEFNLMSLEMYADYLGLVNGYCTTVFGTDNLSTQNVSYAPAPRGR